MLSIIPKWITGTSSNFSLDAAFCAYSCRDRNRSMARLFEADSWSILISKIALLRASRFDLRFHRPGEPPRMGELAKSLLPTDAL